MAGIDRICEFDESNNTFEWPGQMSAAKMNHIQIQPKFRKLFKDAKAKLIIKSVTPQLYRKGCYRTISHHDLNNWQCAKTGQMVSVTPKEYLDYYAYDGWRIAIQYEYVLQVEDKTLFGSVKGKYLNWSFNISTVRRKLSKMLGYKVPVVWECPKINFKERKTIWAIPK